MSNPHYNKDYNSDIIKCKHCGKEITFRKEIRGKNGRMKPLNLDLTPHFCSSFTQYRKPLYHHHSLPTDERVTSNSHYTNIPPDRGIGYDEKIEKIEHQNALLEHFLTDFNEISKQLEINSALLKKLLNHLSSPYRNNDTDRTS
jgi:hypothetical protein